MAAKTNLQSLKNVVEHCELTGTEFLELTAYVLHIHRYLSDPLHLSQLGIDSAATVDVYELLVTDRVTKRKVVLDPSLSIYIQSGQITEGSCVKFTECSVKYDETDLQQRSFLVVHQLTVEAERHITLSDISNIPWCDDCDEIEKTASPLTSSRGYYINIWSSVELEGEVWKRGTIEKLDGLGDVSPVDVYSLKELSKNWRVLKGPPVVIKVLSKKRILHYAKPFKNDKWPLQAHLTVCDRSGCATLVLWNSLCPELYHRLKEGEVLLIQKYTVKKSFHHVDHYRPPLPDGLTMYDIDINVNSHHPVGIVRVISSDAIPACLNLPTIQYNIIQRKDLGCFPSDYVCDITGLVTYVGRFFRERMTGKSDLDTGAFWISRWLELKDQSSQKTCKVLIYRPAEINIYKDVMPGKVLICRHMRIVSNMSHIHASKDNRNMYLTSTGSSHIEIVTGDCAQPHVNDVLTWSQSYKEELTMAGYYSYPPIPTTLAELKNYYEDLKITTSEELRLELGRLSYREHKRLFLFIDNNKIEITTSEELRLELGKLSYREHKRLFIQGQMIAVKYQTKSLSRTRKKEDCSMEVIVNDPLYHQFEQELSSSVIAPPFSYKFDTEMIANLLQFPSVLNRAVDSSELEVSDDSKGCFMIYWSGLNSKILIPTMWMCGPVSTDLTTLLHIRNHTFKHTRNNKDIMEILQSAKQCNGQKFLLVIDAYKPTYNITEIVLNTAYKL
ncbi:RPA-related protein RADX-like [Mytilus trossulus]|uniref:RPA-related protein RADX-like n=1 Tax=Mytilus trossulus TaxID=6551 RepID=UPI003006203E